MYILYGTIILSMRQGGQKMKKEIKKVEKLVNKKGYIPVLSGNEIVFVYNKMTGKEYTPKYSLMIGGEE